MSSNRDNETPENVEETDINTAIVTAESMDSARMLEIAGLISGQLRAADAGDNIVNDVTAYNIRVAELTESLMTTPESVAVSRLAYSHQIEQIIRNNNSLQNLFLLLAEDLMVELTTTQVDIINKSVVNMQLRVHQKGSYKMEQLVHIALLARKKITALNGAIEHAALFERDQHKEIEVLNEKLSIVQRQLTELKNTPPPPQVLPSPYVMYYIDSKDRINYLGKQGASFVRTRNLREALRCPSIQAAGLILLELLRDIHNHAFPQAYRLEIGDLRVINQPLAGLDKSMQTDLFAAKTTAAQHAKENKASQAKTKIRRKKTHRRAKVE